MRATLGRLFGDGFRLFFLAAGVFGMLSALYWEGWLGVHAFGGMVTAHAFAHPPSVWHAHEMVFGYAGAALGGFFLTAVPSWTGARAARHDFIGLAATLWLAGRIAVWMSASIPAFAVAAIDLAFLPVLAAKILTQLLRRPKPQNMMFLALLTLLWLSNLAVHADWTGLGGPGAETGLRAGLLSVCAIIAVLGGRITPAFTRNAMNRAGLVSRLPESRRPFDGAGVALAILVPLAVLAGFADHWAGVLALLCGAAQLARLSGWRSAWTLGKPILWSMHVAFAMLAIGYVLLGIAWLGFGSEIAALHILGIGAVGGMTLAVMSRAILGHTGRPLVAPAPIVVAYGCMALAAIARWIGSSAAIEHYFAAMLVSGAFWIAAMTIFVLAMLPAILGPKLSD
ncbi:NnrS family protein [Oricola sp.]|uniref:NnrS family protein n=1 Tax=Oricola sp. TaxID=1979950 RepID=UPI003BADB64C